MDITTYNSTEYIDYCIKFCQENTTAKLADFIQTFPKKMHPKTRKRYINTFKFVKSKENEDFDFDEFKKTIKVIDSNSNTSETNDNKKRKLDLNDEPTKKTKLISSPGFEEVEIVEQLNGILDFSDTLMERFYTASIGQFIAVKGPKSSGKSTFIMSCAKKFNYRYVKVTIDLRTYSIDKFVKSIAELSQVSSKLLFHIEMQHVSQKVIDSFLLHKIDFETNDHVFMFEMNTFQRLQFEHRPIVFPRFLKADRMRYIRYFATNLNISEDLMDQISNWTQGFQIGHIKSLMKQMSYLIDKDQPINEDIVIQSINEAKSGIPQINSMMYASSTVSWEDIGGHEYPKSHLQETIIKLMDDTNTNKIEGILLHGPPGTGKTMMAKAVSSKLEVAFINVEASSILDKYQGESEKKVGEWFEKAKMTQPCILFIDEIDCICRKRSDENQGSINNIVTEFLKKMDGLDEDMKKVLVIGTTNFKENIDDAILRKGRLGNHIHVTLPSNKLERFEVLNATFRKAKFNSDTERREVLMKISDDEYTKNFSQAELSSLKSGNNDELLNFDELRKRTKAFKREKEKQFAEVIILKEDLAKETQDYLEFPGEVMDEISFRYDTANRFLMNNMKLRGEKCSGKSTLIKLLAHKHNKNVIFMRDNFFENLSFQNLSGFLKNFVEDHHGTFVSISPRVNWFDAEKIMKELSSIDVFIIKEISVIDTSILPRKGQLEQEFIKKLIKDKFPDDEFDDIYAKVKDHLSICQIKIVKKVLLRCPEVNKRQFINLF